MRAFALAHGRIASLRMGPMSSMVFGIGDPVAVAGLKPGDKVKFRAAMVGQQPTVTEIHVAGK